MRASNFAERIAYMTLEKIDFAYLTLKLEFLPICPQLQFCLPKWHSRQLLLLSPLEDPGWPTRQSHFLSPPLSLRPWRSAEVHDELLQQRVEHGGGDVGASVLALRPGGRTSPAPGLENDAEILAEALLVGGDPCCAICGTTTPSPLSACSVAAQRHHQ